MPETEVMLSGQGGDLPTLGAVKPGNGPFFVVVDWAEGSRAGTTDVIDLAPVILTYKTFKLLRDDPALFATVRLSEYGDAIEWGPDDSLAVAGTTLERLAEEAMTAAQFGAFMKRHGMTLNAAAAQLGLSRRMIAYYAKGAAIPRTVALACLYLDAAAQNETLAEPVSSSGAAGKPIVGLLTHPAAKFYTHTHQGTVKVGLETSCCAFREDAIAPARKGLDFVVMGLSTVLGCDYPPPQLPPIGHAPSRGGTFFAGGEQLAGSDDVMRRRKRPIGS